MSVIALPTPVTVTNKISRIQPYVAPYLIINQNLFATVWAANNAGLSPGGGTPIPPGTSVPWTSGGDIFFVLGNDAPSVAQGSAAIIISYDASNWVPSPVAIATAILNSGTLVIDNPTPIVGPVASFGPNTTSIAYDVSHFNSLLVTVQQGIITADSSFWIDWSPDGTTWSTTYPAQTWEMKLIGGAQIKAIVPCVAKFFRIGCTNTTLVITIIASYRTVQQTRQFLPASSPALPVLLETSSFVAVGGTSAIAYVPPWFGDVHIEFQADTGAATNAEGLFSLSISNTGTGQVIVVACDGTNGSYRYFGRTYNRIRIPLWGAQLGISAVNTSGANAATFRATVIPVSVSVS